jgi:alpha-tubulin suppressor-like RCC1 family protein
VSSVAVGAYHVLALAEDGLVFAWGGDEEWAVLGNLHVESELLPKPLEALRGVRVGSVAAATARSYAVADTGEVWAWGIKEGHSFAPLGHGEPANCILPKPIDSLRGIKVDLVIASFDHTLAPADEGSMYAWGTGHAAQTGMLGLHTSVSDAGWTVCTPQRVPELRVTCGL